jgi:hypothetical protein
MQVHTTHHSRQTVSKDHGDELETKPLPQALRIVTKDKMRQQERTLQGAMQHANNKATGQCAMLADTRNNRQQGTARTAALTDNTQ